MEAENSITEFLSNVKKKVDVILNSEDQTEKFLHFVVGNESADLDSVVASLVLSYHMQVKMKDGKRDLFIPIINTLNEDLVLRTEIIAIFDRLQLNLSEYLLYKKDLIRLTQRASNWDVTLVDHNTLTGDLAFLNGHVTMVIDHHQDSGTFDDPYITKNIDQVGSCCTLVAEHIYNQNDHLFSQYPISELLLSAVVLDTVNLDQCSFRTTEKDVEFAEELESFSSVPKSELFEIAQKAKFDMRRLACKDMLRKDFKMVPLVSGSAVRIGISSMTLPVLEFLDRAGWRHDSTQFLSDKKLEILIMMFIHMEAGETQREILTYTPDLSLAESLHEFLGSLGDLHLTSLNIELNSTTATTTRVYSQGNVSMSRKFLLPILSRFICIDYDHDPENHSITRQSNNPIQIEAGSFSEQKHASSFTDEVNGQRLLANESLDFVDNQEVDERLNSSPANDDYEDMVWKLNDRNITRGFTTGNQSEINEETPTDDAFIQVNNRPISIPNSPSAFNPMAADDITGPVCQSDGHHRIENIDQLHGTKYGNHNTNHLTMGSFNSQEKGRCSNVQFEGSTGLADLSHEGEKSLDQPTLEFEEDWNSDLYKITSPKRQSTGSEKKHKIMIRDLSFDESNTIADLSGMDLLCPVFLAVTEDDDDDDIVLKNMRRKTKSIENLCSDLAVDEDFPLRRTKSELPMVQKATKKVTSKRIATTRNERNIAKRNQLINRHDSIQEEVTYEQNPFAGDREFHNNDHNHDSDRYDDDNVYDDNEDVDQQFSDDEVVTPRDSFSDSFRSSSKITRSFSESSSRRHDSFKNTVERFSFSDESLEMYESHERGCGCPICYAENSARDIEQIDHVPGLWERFITVAVGDVLRVVDLKLIEPYMKVISHGGIHSIGNETRVLMVFTAAYLPQKFIPKYQIVMEQLFYFVIHTLDLSVGDDYDIVYFNTNGPNIPGREWLKKCYDMIEKRLKKNLKKLYLVHPNFWLKATLRLYRPFISSKFFKKIRFVKSLNKLRETISLEYIFIPDEVKREDPHSQYWLRR